MEISEFFEGDLNILIIRREKSDFLQIWDKDRGRQIGVGCKKGISLQEIKRRLYQLTADEIFNNIHKIYLLMGE